jgi:hypothetical protein
MTDDHAGLTIKTGQTANDGMIIGVGTITVEFLKIGENQINVIQRVWALRMPCNQCALPGCELGVDFLGQ